MPSFTPGSSVAAEYKVQTLDLKEFSILRGRLCFLGKKQLERTQDNVYKRVLRCCRPAGGLKGKAPAQARSSF